jgi:hypothetical protein
VFKHQHARQSAITQHIPMGRGIYLVQSFMSLVGQKENGGKNKGDIYELNVPRKHLFVLMSVILFLYSLGSF